MSQARVVYDREMHAVLVLGIVGFIVIGIVAATMRKGYETTLQELGQSLGLRYERLAGHGLQAAVGVGHVLRGWVDGRGFELVVAPEGRQRILAERWSIQLCGELPGGFAAGRNGLLRSTSEGMTRVQSGDPEFDKKVLAEGVDPAQAWLVLAAEPRKAALRELAAMNAVVFGNAVVFSKQGFDNNVARLRERLGRLRAIAAALDPVQPAMAYAAAPG